MLNKQIMRIITLFVLIFYVNSTTYPVALFHGIGDACNFQDVLDLTTYLRGKLQTEVKCIEIGNGFISSWFMQFSEQSKESCEKIKNEELFSGKFSVFGISQGSLIARYIVQVCEIRGQVMNYISLDGPQMGIGTLPKINCPVICPMLNSFFGRITYSEYFQKNLGPAGYFKYKHAYDLYLEYSSFLADLNNERDIKNEAYKIRFSRLEKVLLIKNNEDTVITPVESTWFEFYDILGERILPLKESKFYMEDFIGLRILMENNKVTFAEFKGDHVQFTYDDIDKHVIPILQ